MSHDDKTPLLEHSHDGIQEYDNPLPSWWLWTFFVTIIFGFHYWIHYEFGGGMTIKDELAHDMNHIHANAKANPPSQDKEEDLQALVADSSALEQGKNVFTAKCAVCHGQELEGSIGPNLTDDYWIHGKGHLTEIAQVVRNGILDKGMPAWDTQLKPDELKALVVFVGSRRGSNPANPKAPQGEKVGH